MIVEGVAPAIIPSGLWAAAQARHGTRKFGVGRPWHRPYLLSGLIVCGRCGKRFRSHKQTRGLIPSYFVCGSYIVSGPSVCDGLRVPTPYLDDAVIDGIQKRLERALDRETLTGRLREMLRAGEPDLDATASVATRLADVTRRIGRLVDALAGGSEDLPSVRARLGELERERRSIETEVGQARARAAACPEDLEATIDALIEALDRLPDVLATGEPEERKAVVRVFLQEIRIEKTTRQAILRWHRLPHVTESLKLVELRGLEPLTPRLPALCSPN